jgi:hypothetical protein
MIDELYWAIFFILSRMEPMNLPNRLGICPIQYLWKNTMRKKIIALLLCPTIPLSLAIAPLQAYGVSQKTITAEQVNGTWQKKNGVFRIWAVGKQKLRIEFQGTYKYQSQAGPTANIGYGKGTAYIKENTAIFKPENSEAECKISMVFSNKKLIVKQESNCGFGLNVSSSGTYSRANSQKPEFSDL